MSHSVRLQRLVGILEQLLDLVRSRTTSNLSSISDADTFTILRRRRVIEWLADNDINAFRLLTQGEFFNDRCLPLATTRTSLTWGYGNSDRDTLYSGSRPFVFFMPGEVAHVSIPERAVQYRLDLEITPLALNDVLALDSLIGFGRPVSYEYPRSLLLSHTFHNEDDTYLPDLSTGETDEYIAWSDVGVKDYLLVEVGVTRVHVDAEGWFLVFKLKHGTRLATTP